MSKRAFLTAGCASTPSKGLNSAFSSAGFSSSSARAGAGNRRFSICSAGWKSRLRAKSSMREGRFLRCLPASLMSTAPARRALSFRRKTSSPRSPSRKTSPFRTLPLILRRSRKSWASAGFWRERSTNFRAGSCSASPLRGRLCAGAAYCLRTSPRAISTGRRLVSSCNRRRVLL